MAGVLRRAYVEVLPDTKGFDKELTEKLKRGDAGGKIGKQLGGQLNRALSKLDLPALDVKANPKEALAAIEAVEHKLQGMSRDAATVEVKVQTEKALSQLNRFKKQLGEVGDGGGEEAASGFVGRFIGRLGPLMASAPVSGPAGAAGAAIGVAMAPTIAAGVAGAVVGGAGIGGVIGGVLLAARDDRVKQAGSDLGDSVLFDLEKRAGGFVVPTLGAINRIRQGFTDIGPDLDRIFNSSRFVEPLVDGAIKGAKGFIDGFADAVDEADPVIEALRLGIADIGVATGGVFRTMAGDAKEGASAISDLTGAVSNLITFTGGLVHATASVKGWTDQLDQSIDKGRSWIEDNSQLAGQLDKLGVKLDLTADGFKVGSAEADAYRKITEGTATATDFATVKQAGMADSAILAADATGKYRGQLEQVRASTLQAAAANGSLVASAEDVTAKQAALTQAQEAYKRSIDALGPAAGSASLLVDGLRKAQQAQYGATISASEANEAYQSSWDSLSESVKTNKGTLDIHTTAGRANRDSLQDLLGKTNELYFAEIATGASVAGATKKHNDRIAAVKEEARRVGLNKVETDKLITTYGQIPKKKTTDLVMEGLSKVAKALTDLYVFQRSLASGKSIASVETELRKGNDNGPAKRYGGYAEGGWTGPGSKFQKAGDVHADEFVIQKSSRRKIESRAPGLLDEMNATGQLPGYAAGGTVAPVDMSRQWKFPTDVSGTRIPSRAEVASKVPFAFGNWPSSPSAQRGDSGVWRSVVRLIKSTGPVSGSFGNAYRAGDPLWHGSGRAVDWMGFNQDALASFLAARKPLELIHRTAKRDYAYTRGRDKGSFNESLMNAHRNHVHIAMDDGGMRMLQPGINVIPNGTGRPEPIAGPAAMAAMGGNTYNIKVSVPVGAHPAETGRQIILAIQASEKTNGNRWRKS
jgi:hypothetical protein